MTGRLLLEWRTKQALEYEKKNRQYTNEEMFQDDQMIYLLAPHSSALQTDTTKFKQDFIGPKRGDYIAMCVTPFGYIISPLWANLHHS